jgi:AcrR family transcriptional regulator
VITTVSWRASIRQVDEERGLAKQRSTRAHGEESRQKILDAAAEIAGERGYDGTSIALVSARSGLPASSIYWHFEDKDELIAAVIERSFGRWLEGMDAWLPLRGGVTKRRAFAAALRRTGQALLDSPEFLRLGLMLSLERRPEEASARRLFLQVREQTFKRMLSSYETLFAGELDPPTVRALATLTMAAADGLFIARELDAKLDFEAHFELLAAAILGAADSARKSRSARSRRR